MKELLSIFSHTIFSKCTFATINLPICKKLFMPNKYPILGFQLENSYQNLPQSLFTKIRPQSFPNPQMLMFNKQLASELGLNGNPEDYTPYFSGNEILPNSEPIAQAYGGHQFGHFTVLGDGRAILLGEQISASNKKLDIQLKGSGRTPYSRSGDGKATLSAMLREYCMSEALHFLGIPTSRSLAVLATGEPVFRETPQHGAVLTRVASSHIRVGTFEFARRYLPIEDLKALADYTLLRHYPELFATENPYLSLLNSVIEKQADLIVNWMRVGFIHGVMNTDNMTISGETIDYGPCAFMNNYNSETVFSSIDTQGRYAFGNQPKIAQWNLACLAGALLPLIHSNQKIAQDMASKAIEDFQTLYENKWVRMMGHKLGIFEQKPSDSILINELLDWMESNKADYTNTFVFLQNNTLPIESIYQKPDFVTWHSAWQKRIEEQTQSKEEANELMKQNNPVVIPRNHLVEEALESVSTASSFSLLQELLKVVQNPYSQNTISDKYLFASEMHDLNYKTYCGT